MDWRTSSTSSGRLAGLTIIVAVIAAIASGNTAMAQSSNSASQAGLVGTWTVQVTLRDCQTNAPLGPPFRSLATFHRGGTASGSASNLAFAIGQRSQEHTTWTHVGEGVYVQHIAALILFDTPPNLPGPGFNPALPISPGLLAGLQTVTHTIELTNANQWSSSGTNAFYNVAGQLL